MLASISQANAATLYENGKIKELYMGNTAPNEFFVITTKSSGGSESGDTINNKKSLLNIGGK